MMNLIQISDAIQNLPLDTVMKYANGLNPQVPAYLALGELNRRKMLEVAAKGAAATAPPTVKTDIENALLQQRPMANPAANPQMANPVAAQPMANPGAAPQGLVNLAAAQPQVNMGAAPTAMMADGGVTSLMPSSNMQRYPEDGEDPSNYPQRSSPLEMNYGGLTAIPMQGMFNAGSYAGGGIVAFDDNQDQPVSVDMPANNTPSADVERPVTAEEIFQQLIAAQTASNANPPMPIPGSETAAVTSSDSTPVVVPADKPAAAPAAARAPSGALVPTIDKPETKTTEELIAEKQALNRRFGVSEDPMAESKAIQAKNYERQQAEISKQPWDKLFATLAAAAKADPTKGIGAIGAKMNETSLEVGAVQRAYTDKIEEANLQYRTAVAKEEDARKRGDVKGIEEAKAAQQKAQFEYGKYMNDYQNTISSRIQAGAASSQAATAAGKLKLESDLSTQRKELLEAQAKEALARAQAALAGMEPKEQQAVKNSLASDENYKRWSQTVQTREKGGQGYAPGTPQGDAVTAYLSDYQAARAFEIRNNLPIGSLAPTPPKITKDSLKEGTSWWQKDVVVPGTIEPHKPGGFIPVPVPTGAKPKDLVVGRQVYALPNGNNAIWNGKEFVVVK